MSVKLTRLQIVAALKALDYECKRRGITGEICIYGGAEMVLVFDARDATRDVDAIFRPKSEIREAAQAVAEDLGLPETWLNDGVKGYIARREELTERPISELGALSNLRLTWPSADYLLAMKCIAARIADYDTDGDRRDVEFLIKSLSLREPGEVFERIERFYSKDFIHVKTRYFVEEIL